MRPFVLLLLLLLCPAGLSARSLVLLEARARAPERLYLGPQVFLLLRALEGSSLAGALVEEDHPVVLAEPAAGALPWSAWNLSLLRVKSAWSYSRGRGVLVAILDTGLDLHHPALQANLWRNRGEDWLDERTPGYNGLDDDGNGVVDDYYGYNAIEHSGRVEDDHGHGTAVAGIIGASGEGYTGVAPGVRFLVLKVLDENGQGYVSDVLRALAYALEIKRRTGLALVFNLSWALAYPSQVLKEALEGVYEEAQAPFVVAAGNDGLDLRVIGQYPASFPLRGQITVTSLSPRGKLSWFANYGPGVVDLAAPGESILAPWRGGGFRVLSGTSFATAHVTGLVALLLARNPRARPWELQQALLAGAVRVPGLEPWVTRGRVAHALRPFLLWYGPRPFDLSGNNQVDPGDFLLFGLRLGAEAWWSLGSDWQAF